MTSVLEFLKELHSSEGISHLIQLGGFLILMGIIFAETGLLFGFFLPGDSLLITAGVLSNPANPSHLSSLDILPLNLALIIAVILGDQCGYFLGKLTGDKIWAKPDTRFYKKAHLLSAQAFYKKYGGLSIALGKYVPIVRTFVPFFAGVAKMPYRKFCIWNISGGVIWITLLLWIGYYLGQTPLASRLDRIIVLVVFVSILPILIGALKKYFQKKAV
jgi:membrane-associated protein